MARRAFRPSLVPSRTREILPTLRRSANGRGGRRVSPPLERRVLHFQPCPRPPADITRADALRTFYWQASRLRSTAEGIKHPEVPLILVVERGHILRRIRELARVNARVYVAS